MAGVSYWDGSASTDCTAAANWTAGAGPGSTPPAAGDEVIFDARANGGGDPPYAPTTVCDVGDTGGIDFDLFHVKQGATYDIGVAGAPYHTSAQKIIIEGSGTYYIEVSESGATDQNIPLVIINNPSATVYLTSNRNDGVACCEFTEVIVIAGKVHIGNNGSADVVTAVQYLRLCPRDNKVSNVTVTIYKDCERLKATAYEITIDMQNGTLTMNSAALLIEQYQGTLNYGTAAAAPALDCYIETLRVFNGTFNWYPDISTEAGTPYIGDLFMFGGSFNSNASTNNDGAKELGNGAGNDIWLFYGASMDISNSMGNITIATNSQLWNFGATLVVDNASQLAVSYDQP